MLNRCAKIGAVVGFAIGLLICLAGLIAIFSASPGIPGPFEVAFLIVGTLVCAAVNAVVGCVIGLIVGVVLEAMSNRRQDSPS